MALLLCCKCGFRGLSVGSTGRVGSVSLSRSKKARGGRMRRVLVLMVSFFVLAVVLMPGTVSAQSAIAGVVRDASRAVIPGVTVEAASPALIEKTRSVRSEERRVGKEC